MKYKYIAEVLEWFDKTHANTYFSVCVTCTRTGKQIRIPMQYGYGSHFRTVTLEEMEKAKLLPVKYRGENRWLYERENNYPIYWVTIETTKARVKAHGGE